MTELRKLEFGKMDKERYGWIKNLKITNCKIKNKILILLNIIA